MKNRSGHNSFLRHFVWYFSGAVIPLLINFIKTPIFTRHYSAEDFGILGLVLIGVGYVSTLLFSWLTSCLWRFYPGFKAKNHLPTLYSNLVFLYAAASVIMLLIAFLSSYYFDSELVKDLIYLASIHFMLREFLNLYFIILRLKGKSRQYNLLISVQTVLSFLLLLIMAFALKFNISSLILSLILIDILFIIFIWIKSFKGNLMKFLNPGKVSFPVQKQLFRFGGITLISTLLLMLIVSSDRYIISLYEPMKEVGIYTKSYDVAQMSILALIFIFFSTINPTMNHVLENKKESSNSVISRYIHAFSFLFLPVVIIASIFRREITEILLGDEFYSGFVLMPYIFISMLFFGIIKFYENEYKFSERLKEICYFFTVGLIVNLVLNFVFIPKYGMIWAAISTLISYGIILLLFVLQDKFSHFRNELYNSRFGFLMIILLIFFLIDHFLRLCFEFTLISGITEAIIFTGILVAVFYKDVKSLQIPMFEG